MQIDEAKIQVKSSLLSINLAMTGGLIDIHLLYTLTCIIKLLSIDLLISQFLIKV